MEYGSFSRTNILNQWDNSPVHKIDVFFLNILYSLWLELFLVGGHYIFSFCFHWEYWLFPLSIGINDVTGYILSCFGCAALIHFHLCCGCCLCPVSRSLSALFRPFPLLPFRRFFWPHPHISILWNMILNTHRELDISDSSLFTSRTPSSPFCTLYAFPHFSHTLLWILLCYCEFSLLLLSLWLITVFFSECLCFYVCLFCFVFGMPVIIKN